MLVNRIGNRFTALNVGDTSSSTARGADTNECGDPGQGPFYEGPQSRCRARSTSARSDQNFIKRVVASR